MTKKGTRKKLNRFSSSALFICFFMSCKNKKNYIALDKISIRHKENDKEMQLCTAMVIIFQQLQKMLMLLIMDVMLKKRI